MTAIQRRLQRLERSMPRSDPWSGMDDIIDGLTDSELRTLIDRTHPVGNGQPTTPEQDAVWAMFEERARAVGIT